LHNTTWLKDKESVKSNDQYGWNYILFENV
jgi:hypothetical protein